MATFDKRTGRLISGFAEVLQSIDTIVNTKVGSRVMRREFGSELPRLVDRGVSDLTLIEFYAAIAGALKAEPRFRVVQMLLSEDSDLANGNPIFDVKGVYFPRGHLGDYSEAEDATGRVILDGAT
ncbi:GPW/gp25 family protein [Methylobacterium sp. WCS2018Hpa-22]|uniref:GPW/gp25 family protein n=1 Tax=Methylobacterium sp. WCS2018Hpa-22 TaxID=3073633 RepID=UPI00288B77DB|nr:GPW/gp25 family protein [Methylobacterium sp. WCS2018Hpa-22]